MSNRKRQISVAAATALALCAGALASACGGGSEAPTTVVPSVPEGGNTGPSRNASADEFDPSKFGGDPATGANEWLPLEPGTQWTRQGFVNVGHRRLPHRVVTTVTDVSKEIDGVRTAIVLDQSSDRSSSSTRA